MLSPVRQAAYARLMAAPQERIIREDALFISARPLCGIVVKGAFRLTNAISPIGYGLTMEEESSGSYGHLALLV